MTSSDDETGVTALIVPIKSFLTAQPFLTPVGCHILMFVIPVSNRTMLLKCDKYEYK